MDRQAAVKLIKDTFEHPFEKERFRNFTKNLLSHVEITEAHPYSGNIIPDAYESFISTLERIGKYSDSEDHKIDILMVKLKKGTSLDRARSRQRNFIAWYLNGSRGGELKDAALVAFVSPDEEDWRFSLVKMDYHLEESLGGKIKVKTELTPARRWSFLVGKHESSHTAQKQLLPILENDKLPQLSDLGKAFNIEVVTREFFEKYRGLFDNVKEALEGLVKESIYIQKDFTAKEVDIEIFSKKLLGQIAFLYFLQKKGWLGVPANKTLGEGDRRFLRSLFEKCGVEGKNFFNEYLEYLFYDALNRQDRDTVYPGYYKRFDCNIPFLNGGLFDPINSYDWKGADIQLSNELFSNDEKMKEGDTGTGILDVFDRYNFTVKEDEPLEKEVAIDPEMLGKVFENLLEVKDRKSKGTYYTPREIVHYMCQESLINYLDTAVNTGEMPLVKEKPINLKLFGAPAFQQQALKTPGNTKRVPREDIEAFVRVGELAIEHDLTAIQNLDKIEQGIQKTTKYQLKLRSIQENASLIDDALANIRVCDPAIGSGAFPVGLMTEIVRARNTLTTYLPDKEARTSYHFKRHAIQSCLYGVDIDPGAVEIAKLRLWLSLVVDEEDIKQIQPLPNLDYKIVCGNSLLGVKRDMFNNDLFRKLEELKTSYFSETNAKKKQDYKKQIDQLIKQLTNNNETFDFEVYFSEVFHEKGGFDVVIANPPYIEHKKLKGLRALIGNIYETHSATSDIYVYFYEKAIKILIDSGILTFISSNKFLKTNYGIKLRNFLTKYNIKQIIDFTDIHIFDALVATCILIILKRNRSGKIMTISADDSIQSFTHLYEFVDRKHQIISSENLGSEIWQLSDSVKLKIKSKIESIHNQLKDLPSIHISRGLTTGYNEAFIIDNTTAQAFIASNKVNKEIIKPLLQGRNIRKWHYLNSNLYILQTRYDLDIRKFPEVFAHLAQFKNELMTRLDQGKHWWNLRACAYYAEFEKEKIIWGLTADKWAFAYDDKGHYLPSNGYILTSFEIPIKYLLALLNSRLMEFYFAFIGIMTAGGAFTLKHETISDFPIMQILKTKQKPFIDLVDQILAITRDEDYLTNLTKQTKVKELERQIDLMVYELYGLTPEEIAIVEGFNKK